MLNRTRQAIHSLAENPRPSGYKKMMGYENLYRIRVGDWRIIYAIEDDKLVILILTVAPRGRIYRKSAREPAAVPLQPPRRPFLRLGAYECTRPAGLYEMVRRPACG